MREFNQSVLRQINQWPDGLAPVMRLFSEATQYLGIKLGLLALVVGLIVAKGKYRAAAVQALLAVGLGNFVTDLFKKGIPMPRPCNEMANVLGHGIGCTASMGTASAHSANMAAVAFVFVYYLGWWGSPWILIAFFTGISRMYHGAHYPYQVLLGWTVGISAGFAITQIAKLIRRKPADVSTEEPGHEVPIA